MTALQTTDVWFRKLIRLVDLNNAEREALAALPFTLETTSANRYLVKEGEKVTRCCLLMEGYVARHKMNREGKRQIVSFHMPGDMVDLQHSLLPTADHNIQTMTAAT